MAKLSNIIFISCLIFAATNGLTRKGKFILDERYVCVIKTDCIDCLKLPQCSWCPTEKQCFSRHLKLFDGFCLNNTINHHDHGLSLRENAECSCISEEIQPNCSPPGTTGPVCSGRGTCVCGQCKCDPLPDPNEPTKMVLGEYCEFDNFSCDGPKCNEGPYSIIEPNADEDRSAKPLEVDDPASMSGIYYDRIG